MNIMANATMTLVIELMSVPNPILDNGPINKTSNPPPTSIRIHIQKINEKIDTFMTIQFP